MYKIGELHFRLLGANGFHERQKMKDLLLQARVIVIFLIRRYAVMTTTATLASQICIFSNVNSSPCTFCTCGFHFCILIRRSRSFHDVKRPGLQLCGRRKGPFIFYEVGGAGGIF